MIEEKNSNKRVTIRDIARRTGYSVSTVSKALNDSHEISEATRQQIIKVCNEHGYIPNKTALSLRSGKNYVIAFIIPSIEDTFYARISHGIQHEVINTNYSITTCITRDSLEKEMYLIKKVFNQVDAFIVSLSKEAVQKKDYAHLDSIIEAGKPLVLINNNIEELNCYKILSNNKLSFKNLINHIHRKKVRNLVIVSSQEDEMSLNKLKTLKGELDLVLSNSFNKHVIAAPIDVLDQSLANLIKKQDIDCVLSLDEEASFAAIRIVTHLGMKVPNDIRLVGYMSEKVAENLPIPFTTINQHRKTMGIEAVRLILHQLEKNSDNFKNRIIEINSNVSERASF